MIRVPHLFAFHRTRHRWVARVARNALFLACLSISCASWAQIGDKYADIVITDEAPNIDGQLIAGEWEDATVIRDLHQVTPVEFSSPTEDTIWYVMYDTKALYVAAIAYDSRPDRISAQTLRQGGSLNSDDKVTVLVDPFNNKRSGYAFSVNPRGVREDGIYTNGTRLSDDWDGVWRSAADITSEGWAMELAIPFNTLTFDPENDTWGFNLKREIQRKSESMAWSSRNGATDPTVSGELRGISGINQGRGLDVIPSMSSTWVGDHLDNGNESDFRPSVDVSYKLTPAINMLVTVNTDFAATEVDSRQLDLSRFSLFFPEKRSFFLTDFDIFQFGGISTGRGRGGVPGAASRTNGLAFFSRRIGLGPSNEQVDIIGGLKLSGRIGKTDFGTLYVRQDEFEDVDASDLVIVRLSRGILSESSVGAILTSGDPTSNETSSLVGLDFNFRNTRLADNRTLESWFWIQKSSNEGMDGDDIAYSAALGFPTEDGWEFGGQIHEAQANYDPRLGFANRTGVRMYSGRVARKWILEESRRFQWINSNINFNRWEYLDTRRVQSQRTEFNLINIRTTGSDFGRAGISSHKERLLDGENPLERLGIDIPPGEYAFNRYTAFFRTGQHRRFSLALRLENGDFYNGKRLDVRPQIGWRVNSHLLFDLQYAYGKYEFPGAEATTRQITFNNEIAFNANWSLLTLAQYDNLSDDIGINMRLRYNRAAGQDVWLVLNHNMRKYDPGDPEYRGDGFRNVETVAALKVRYTFRF